MYQLSVVFWKFQRQCQSVCPPWLLQFVHDLAGLGSKPGRLCRWSPAEIQECMGGQPTSSPSCIQNCLGSRPSSLGHLVDQARLSSANHTDWHLRNSKIKLALSYLTNHLEAAALFLMPFFVCQDLKGTSRQTPWCPCKDGGNAPWLRYEKHVEKCWNEKCWNMLKRNHQPILLFCFCFIAAWIKWRSGF